MLAANAGYAQVAMDGNDAMAVWSQLGEATYTLWSSRYVAGSGWGSAELIKADAQHATAQLAFDGAGNAIAVWDELNGALYDIWANRYVAGTGWGDAELIETDDVGHGFAPRVAFDGAGNALVVWYQGDDPRFDIWANRYVAGTGWGSAELIETTDTSSAVVPELAVDSSGNAIVMWNQGSTDTGYDLWFNRYVAGTGWSGPELFAPIAGDNDIVFDGSGNAIAVWGQFDGTRSNLWSSRFE